MATSSSGHKISERRPGQRGRTKKYDGPDPIDVHVGRRLRQARLLAGFNQEELAKAIGTSFQAVQKYEHGENRISASRLARAANLLRRPVAFFFQDVDEVLASVAAQDGFSREEIELMRCYRGVQDSHVRHQLLQVVKNLSAACRAKPKPKPKRKAIE